MKSAAADFIGLRNKARKSNTSNTITASLLCQPVFSRWRSFPVHARCRHCEPGFIGRGNLNLSPSFVIASPKRAAISSFLFCKPQDALHSLHTMREPIQTHHYLSTTETINLFYRQVRMRKGLPFSVVIPNKTTERVFTDTDAKRNLIRCDDAEDMFYKLGM